MPKVVDFNFDRIWSTSKLKLMIGVYMGAFMLGSCIHVKGSRFLPIFGNFDVLRDSSRMVCNLDVLRDSSRMFCNLDVLRDSSHTFWFIQSIRQRRGIYSVNLNQPRNFRWVIRHQFKKKKRYGRNREPLMWMWEPSIIVTWVVISELILGTL